MVVVSVDYPSCSRASVPRCDRFAFPSLLCSLDDEEETPEATNTEMAAAPHQSTNPEDCFSVLQWVSRRGDGYPALAKVDLSKVIVAGAAPSVFPTPKRFYLLTFTFLLQAEEVHVDGVGC